VEIQGQRWAIQHGKGFLEAGAEIFTIESEGITEQVVNWRTDVPARITNELGIDKVMFEAADTEVFRWYIKNYGPEVNLFVDHSQILELECLQTGIWSSSSLWRRVLI
jgi:phosphosulfolactate synthase (CoM biosynthesis protein A)